MCEGVESRRRNVGIFFKVKTPIKGWVTPLFPAICAVVIQQYLSEPNHIRIFLAIPSDVECRVKSLKAPNREEMLLKRFSPSV